MNNIMNNIDNEENNVLTGNLGASILDIRGGMFYVTISYDNGYVAKISGELFPGATFIAYKSSIKKWDAPHDKEALTSEMAAKIIADVEKSNGPGKVNIKFQ